MSALVGLPRVEFHFNAPDKLGYASRFLRKAHAKGAHVLVLCAEPQALSAALCLLGDTEFVPHTCLDAAPSALAHSPIWIASAWPQAVPEGLALRSPVLLNLLDGVPVAMADFSRLIEVVSTDEADRHLARLRWRDYKAAGCEPIRHDLG